MGMILLVRHGQASWGASDYDRLSTLGRDQSGITGSALGQRGIRPDLLVRGAMVRHVETMTGIVGGAGWADVEVRCDPVWNEFDHDEVLAAHRPADGRSHLDLGPGEFESWFESALRRWADGEHADDYAEPFAAFGHRAARALTGLAAEMESGRCAVVVTSGGLIAWMATHLLGAVPAGQGVGWARLNPVLVNTGVTTVVTGRRGISLITVNEHTHLDRTMVTYR